MPPKIDSLGLQILFLLLPGIVALEIIKSIGPKKPRSDFENGIHIFLYGVLSYLLIGLINALHHLYYFGNGTSFIDSLAIHGFGMVTDDGTPTLDPRKIIYAIVAAVPMGLAVAILQNYSVVHRLFRAIKFTRRTNELDVWEFAFNSPGISPWVTVRHPNGKVYQGWVRGYSDGGDEREIILGDAAVYAPSPANDGGLLEVDRVPILYLGLDRKAAIIEMQTAAEEA